MKEMDVIQDAIAQLEQAKRMERDAKAQIRGFLAQRRIRSDRYTASWYKDVCRNGAPYSKLIEWGLICITRGCDPEEIRAILEGRA